MKPDIRIGFIVEKVEGTTATIVLVAFDGEKAVGHVKHELQLGDLALIGMVDLTDAPKPKMAEA